MKSKTDKFFEKLTKTLAQDRSVSGPPAKRRLYQLCEKLQEAINDGRRHSAHVSLQPGWKAQGYLIYNLTVEIPERNFRDVLFRVSIANKGPVSLDFYGEDPLVCSTVAQMEDAIIDFLGKEEVRNRLNDYRELCYPYYL
jgi:hypothetical protein